MSFKLCDIVCNIVNEGCSCTKLLFNDISNPKRHHLSVCPCIVCSCCHGAEIISAFWRVCWNTSKLLVRKFNAVLAASPLKNFQVVCADLMARSSRPGMKHNANL